MGSKKITYDEYFELVKKNFSHYNLTEKERNDYLNSNEVQKEIKSKYKYAIQEYEQGIITYDIMTIGTVEAVSYNLWLEY